MAEARAPRGRPAGAALVPGRALAGGSGRARHLRRLDRDERPARRAEQSRPLCPARSRALFPNGNEPVYPAVSRALDDVAALHDPDRINAVVVLSDGAGTDVGRKELLRKIAAEPVTEGTASGSSPSRTATARTPRRSSRSRRTRAARSSPAARRTSRTSTGGSRPTSERSRERDRRLPGRTRARAGRDGDRPSRPSGRPRARGGTEGARRPLGDGSNRDDAVPARGAARRLAQPSQHRHRARVLRARRRALHRDGVPPARLAAAARRDADGSAGRRRPRRHPRRPRPRRTSTGSSTATSSRRT